MEIYDHPTFHMACQQFDLVADRLQILEKDRARLNLDTQVEFNGADGKPLSKLILGKKYFKREVDNPEKAPGDGRFIALPGEAQTVYIISDPLTQATAKSADWIDRRSFQVEKVKTMDMRMAPGAGASTIS